MGSLTLPSYHYDSKHVSFGTNAMHSASWSYLHSNTWVCRALLLLLWRLHTCINNIPADSVSWEEARC